MLAINQKNRRLPGFRFEAFAPAREDILPRMDIALLIGFASTGPVGIPVAIESAEQFRAIFGDDLPLVWDRSKGEILHAYLAPTVRAFFRNGGKRCWVQRVARVEPRDEASLDRACYNFFPLSGFAAARLKDNDLIGISPAFARARSKGSWSDDLQVTTALLSKSVNVLSFTGDAGQKRLTLEIGARESISPGELFRLTCRDERGELVTMFLAVDEIADGEDQPANATEQAPPKRTASFGRRIVECSSRRFAWVRGLPEKIEPQTVPISLWTRQRIDSAGLSPQSFAASVPARLKLESSNDPVSPRKIALTFDALAPADAPAVGSLLLAELNEDLIALHVEAVIPGGAQTKVVCRAAICSRNLSRSASIMQTERLTFELWIRKDKRTFLKLTEMAFNAGHERFWGNLPTDEEWYQFFQHTAKNPPFWTQNAESSNFPLAGGGERDEFYFPLFVGAARGSYLGALPVNGTKLQRDGLERFDEDLFLDPELKDTGAGSLLSEAEFIRYLNERPRPLSGIHCALVPDTVSRVAIESQPTDPVYTNYSLEECTLICVPDAVHRGWSKNSGRKEDSPATTPSWWIFESDWANGAAGQDAMAAGKFTDCGFRILGAPENLRVVEESIAAGRLLILWDDSETPDDSTFVLEESPTPDFQFPTEIYRGAARQKVLARHLAGVYFYRVRAEIGLNFSDWSHGLGVKIPETDDWSVNADYNSDTLLAVQRALLRMCAARGDLFAVLNLPEDFEEKEVFAHVGALKLPRGLTGATGGVEPFSADEANVLSFGAIYYPWLLTREEDLAKFRSIPPDGAICGTYAKRADERGAWIAPANESLQDVLGLAKDVRRERFSDFQNNLINLIRREPSGFLALDSDTLSDDADLRPVNVRRLLSLLRRLATKHGAEYVFEPNSESFRRQVQRGFEALLDLMFRRGAFAGKTPANSYQVVVSGAVNDPRSVDAGRFVVELRVAPSLPLKFVTVRLVQAGARSSVIEVF